MDLKSCEPNFELRFANLCYAVNDNAGKRKPILRNVSGKFCSGRLGVVLGPSGAGKTSLLNLLSGFKVRGTCGTLTLNGEVCNVNTFRRQMCYITQDMALLNNLTTTETMMVAANLKLSSSTSKHCKQKMVTEILELLGLQKTVNTCVGCISGGEKKRLSIALELITNPPFMFFDEPTSGLDSASSTQMITHLKSLARSGRAVVCTLHQPSSRLFSMLDDVLVLAEGQSLYCGSANGLVPAFMKSGFHCPQFYNPADFVLEVASLEHGDNLDGLIRYNKAKQEIVEDERNPEISADTECYTKEYDSMLTSSDSTDGNNTVIHMGSAYKKQQYSASMFTQFYILLHRSLLCTFRDLHLAQLRVATHFIVGLLLGVIYYGIGNDASKVPSNTACIFFFIMFLFFSNAMPTVHSFPLEASVFLREHLNNWYSVTSYFIAKLLSDIPLQVLCPTTFLLLSYFLTAQPFDWVRLLMLWAVCMLLTVLAQTMGLVAGAACELQSGVFVVAASCIPMFLFSGFFLHLKDIPYYLQWISYISYFRFAFEGSMLSVYGFDRQRLECDQPYCFYKSPRKLLADMGMAPDSGYWFCLGGLIGWILFLQITLYAVLQLRLYRAR